MKKEPLHHRVSTFECSTSVQLTLVKVLPLIFEVSTLYLISGWTGKNGSYPANQHCEWLIETNKQYALKFQMIAFELEEGPPDCQFDYFEMHYQPPGMSDWIPYLNTG